jgi:serine/threonine protein kinase
VEGTPFGRYRLVELLGRGGMGEVWRAHDTAIDRTVALKRLLPHFAQDRTFEQRFRREARAAARLDDPHVVPIYDVGEIDGQLYVTMRLIKGHDLQSLLDGGPLEPQRAATIVGQVAAALDDAHKSGLVHRDVKPSNILITDTDFAYLIDFGIARAAGETGITSTGATIGTWAYMAPERFRTGEIEPSSDIYSLACVLYQCLTGQTPFPGRTFEQIALAHIADPPPKPSEKRDAIPPPIDEVIGMGLAKDPGQRYRSATELAAAAQHALTTMPPSTPYTDPTVLNPTKPAVASTIPDKEPPPPAPPTPVPTWQQPAGSAKRSPIRAAMVAPLVLAALFIGAAAFAVTQFLRPYPQPSIKPPQWQAYVDHAKQFTVDMTSLSYQDPDSGVQRVLDESTGQFHDDFASRSSDFKQTIIQSKAVTQGTITGAGLESINGTTAEVLITATSKITNNNGAADEPRTWRLRVQVEKIGDAYKTSKVDFVS